MLVPLTSIFILIYMKEQLIISDVAIVNAGLARLRAYPSRLARHITMTYVMTMFCF